MIRLRFKFSRGEEVKFISHLDIMRLWERAIRRANLPLMYSEGFTPHPRLSLAAPLSLGVTSETELIDIYFSGQAPPQYVLVQISGQLPSGISILDVWQVGLNIPSLQSQVRFAEYSVTVNQADNKTRDDIDSAIARIMSLKEFPWQHIRNASMRTYDLRSLIDSLFLAVYSIDEIVISMKLRCDSSGAGRPEQVTKALGFTYRPRSIHRTSLVLN